MGMYLPFELRKLKDPKFKSRFTKNRVIGAYIVHIGGTFCGVILYFSPDISC